MAPRALWFLTLQADPNLIREETFLDRPHLAIPVVALVEGVIQCATCPEPELVLAAEFLKFPQSWNGLPVTMGHPRVDGIPVSANAPAILEQWSIGRTFNAKALDDRRLGMEAWIDLERAEEAAEGRDLVARVREGEPVEISTGYWAVTHDHEGVYQNERYAAVQEDIKPDHLALLADDQTGACSWEDGCGTPRVNQPMGPNPWPIRVNATRAPCCEACAEGRACEGCQDVNALDGALRAAIESWKSCDQELVSALLANELSDVDLRNALETILDAEIAGTSAFRWPVAVFPQQGLVIYREVSEDGARLIERSFEVADDGRGAITLGDETREVRSVTEFVPAQEDPMKDLIDRLIANQRSPYTESERSVLEGLSEDVLKSLLKQFDAPAEPTAPTEPTEPATPSEPTESELTREQVEAWAADNGMELSQVRSGDDLDAFEDAKVRVAQEKRTLIERIVAAGDFTEEQLKDRRLNDLRQLASLIPAPAPTPDYGRPVGAVVDNADDDIVPVTPGWGSLTER